MLGLIAQRVPTKVCACQEHQVHFQTNGANTAGNYGDRSLPLKDIQAQVRFAFGSVDRTALLQPFSSLTNFIPPTASTSDYLSNPVRARLLVDTFRR